MLQTPVSFQPLFAPHPDPEPLSFLFYQGRLLVREDSLALPQAALLAQLGVPEANLQPLGLLGERYCQAGWLDEELVPPPGYGWRGLRSLFGEMDEQLVGLAARAAQVAEWARTHRFCGACGSGTVLAAGERCFKCVNCGHMAYPRISPAMMVLIRKGDAVLLAMHVASPTKRFVPLAGFLEAGESVEEAVHREVYEEVGLRVTNLRYFGSQSWPFPHSLMLAFTADYVDGEIRVDTSEIAEARWFGPDDEWPERVPHVSISSVLVDAHRPPGRQD
ncbi:MULTISPECIES: NAD(+) diphosphatase [unclassified Massilia]|uniref:NAD(+) diphosphatase n=1 Tax=unclassified Massilia TaxID=2609279 RepID=UPI001B845FBC|nr:MULTISPECIES: NAD(+) diphosphatase [unclassified Massilia]MBQ5940997.1 NAD(+) diphosphatase [Massilia sp. AB1]MBQ5963787.1 NAD(+) diphosphatase [Massilia sp. ZL223]